MSNEIIGIVHQVLPMEAGVSNQSGREWKRQTVVVTWTEGDGRYEHTCYLALQNLSKADEFAKLKVGDEVLFKYDVTSREYNGKWFHSVDCYDWTVRTESQGPTHAPAPAAPAAPTAPATPAPVQDDLPD